MINKTWIKMTVLMIPSINILHFVSFSYQDVEIHTDSAKALADSLDMAMVDGFPYFNTLLRILATRCMMQAVYFCSGMDSDFHHYGLASPIYTHFTSPIRRYENILCTSRLNMFGLAFLTKSTPQFFLTSLCHPYSLFLSI